MWMSAELVLLNATQMPHATTLMGATHVSVVQAIRKMESTLALVSMDACVTNIIQQYILILTMCDVCICNIVNS